jgi:ABC-2 type transport system ATP-binding protein
MFEVQYLADRIALIYKGRIIAEGTPRQLLELFEAENLEEAYVKAIRSHRVPGGAGNS